MTSAALRTGGAAGRVGQVVAHDHDRGVRAGRDPARRHARHRAPLHGSSRCARSPRRSTRPGVDAIEVAHGDGVVGLQRHLRLRRAHRRRVDRARSSSRVSRARVTTLLIPGIGTIDDLRAPARPRRRRACASPPTAPRPTSSAQHIAWARERGHGRLGLPDDEPPQRRPRSCAEQAKLMEAYGAHCVYVTDSGGRLTMDDVAERVDAYRAVLDPEHRDRHPRPPQPLARRRQQRRRPSSTARTPGRRLAGRAGRRRGQRARSRRSSRWPT